MVPKACFLGSSIINEKLKNPKRAADLLRALIKKYPNHDIIPYAENYLRQLKLS